jgi:hypothetical protein
MKIHDVAGASLQQDPKEKRTANYSSFQIYEKNILQCM